MYASDDSYDLVANAWIPVIGRDGAPCRVGLAELGRRAGSLRAFGGPPPVRIALLRLVVAMLRDSLGPDAIAPQRRRGWWERECLPREEFETYLRTHAARLRLFDPRRPFLQDARLRGDRTPVKSVAELAPHLPTGNNATLTRRTTDLGGPNPVRFTAAEAACWLVSAHAHTRPGITGTRDGAPPGRISGRGGPLLGRLAVVPECGSLARTLLLNLPGAARDRLDLPAYRCERPVRRAEEVRGPVSLLTWTTRHVLLVPEPDGTVTGVKIAADPEVDPLVPRRTLAAHDPHLLAAAGREPSAAGGGWSLEPAATERTALADAAVIARHAAVPAPGSVIPAALAAARVGHPVRLSVYGLAVESTSKFTGWTVSSLPCVDHGSAAAAARIARIAAEAAGEAAAQSTGERDRQSGPARRQMIRARTAAAVWQSLDAQGRVLLGRIASGDTDPGELARWWACCVRAARAALSESCHAVAHGSGAAKASARLEITLAATYGLAERERAVRD